MKEASVEGWLVIVLAVAAGALLKAMSGLGMPLVAIPVAAAVIGPHRAVIALAIPAALTNIWLAWRHRAERAHTNGLRAMLITGVAGAVLGAALLAWLADRWLSLGLAVLVVVYVLVRVVQPGFALPASWERWASPLVGSVGGLLQGATGISAPLLAVYLHARRPSPGAFMFGLAVLFTAFGLGQIVSFAVLGLYDGVAIADTVLALVPALIVFPVGLAIGRKLTPVWFDRLVLGLLCAVALGLLARAVGHG